MSGILYIVATPIGNLGDITLRAIETLKAVDIILCEDTRVTKNLLDHFDIKTPTKSYHQHSTGAKVLEIASLLEEGKNIALVTDAGTPGISDPGNLLVHYLSTPAPEHTSTRIVAIPGASAVTAALSVSGFSTDKFLFLGFPPHKNKRQKFFTEVAASEHTVVFYESSHRIKKCLNELAQVLRPDRQVCVCRELTKKFESTYRGTISEIINMNISEKGEFVVIISAS
ncbi:MAG: 16S rRNA (cytidine(1402)-2'-O)-methyltransferase [Patescibacteria group bacterium]